MKYTAWFLLSGLVAFSSVWGDVVVFKSGSMYRGKVLSFDGAVNPPAFTIIVDGEKRVATVDKIESVRFEMTSGKEKVPAPGGHDFEAAPAPAPATAEAPAKMSMADYLVARKSEPTVASLKVHELTRKSFDYDGKVVKLEFSRRGDISQLGPGEFRVELVGERWPPVVAIFPAERMSIFEAMRTSTSSTKSYFLYGVAVRMQTAEATLVRMDGKPFEGGYGGGDRSVAAAEGERMLFLPMGRTIKRETNNIFEYAW